MTVASRPHLLSLDEWRALGEDEHAHVELQEGVLIVSPRPRPAHARILTSLLMQLIDQVPEGFEVLPEVDVVIDAGTPATVRAPDVIIRRVGADDTTITTDQVVLAVEIISPGSRRTDRVTKLSEYAEAGIAHYWIVDEQRALTELTLAPHGYEATTHVGQLVTMTPWPLRVDLTR